MASERRRVITGVVRPEVDERQMEEESKKISGALEGATDKIDLTGLRKKMTREIERAVPGGRTAGKLIRAARGGRSSSGGSSSSSSGKTKTGRMNPEHKRLTMANLKLDRRRNVLLERLISETEEGNIDAARGRGGGGMGMMGLGMLGLGIGGMAGLGKKLWDGLKGGLKDFEWPSPPELPVPDIPAMPLPDEMPEIDIPQIPDPQLELPGDIPDLGLPEIPELGIPDEIPDLGIPDVPDLGLPDIPDLGLPDIPTIPVDAPDFIPVGNPQPQPTEDPNKSPNNDGILDRTWEGAKDIGGAAADAGGDAVGWAKENPYKTAGIAGLTVATGGAAGLAYGSGAGLATLGGSTALKGTLAAGGTAALAGSATASGDGEEPAQAQIGPKPSIEQSSNEPKNTEVTDLGTGGPRPMSSITAPGDSQDEPEDTKVSHPGTGGPRPMTMAIDDSQDESENTEVTHPGTGGPRPMSSTTTTDDSQGSGDRTLEEMRDILRRMEDEGGSASADLTFSPTIQVTDLESMRRDLERTIDEFERRLESVEGAFVQ